MPRTPKYVDLQLTWEHADWLRNHLELMFGTSGEHQAHIVMHNLLEAQQQAIEDQEEADADDFWDSYDPDIDDSRMVFADPGGRSALRAATPDNPRNLPCPGCGAEDVLTPADVALGYHCDDCSDAAERGGP